MHNSQRRITLYAASQSGPEIALSMVAGIAHCLVVNYHLRLGVRDITYPANEHSLLFDCTRPRFFDFVIHH
jgi:hypothetical protein